MMMRTDSAMHYQCAHCSTLEVTCIHLHNTDMPKKCICMCTEPIVDGQNHYGPHGLDAVEAAASPRCVVTRAGPLAVWAAVALAAQVPSLRPVQRPRKHLHRSAHHDSCCPRQC